MGGNTDSANLYALRKLMKKHKLTRKQVAKMANRCLQTVNQWFSVSKKSHRRLMDDVLERITWKLK